LEKVAERIGRAERTRSRHQSAAVAGAAFLIAASMRR